MGASSCWQAAVASINSETATRSHDNEFLIPGLSISEVMLLATRCGQPHSLTIIPPSPALPTTLRLWALSRSICPDVEYVLQRFQEEYDNAVYFNRMELDTSSAMEEESLAEWVEKMEPYWTDNDRLRMLTHRQGQA